MQEPAPGLGRPSHSLAAPAERPSRPAASTVCLAVAAAVFLASPLTAGSFTCTDVSQTHNVDVGSTPLCGAGGVPGADICLCNGLGDLTICSKPELVSQSASLTDPGCDPATTACSVQIEVEFKHPGNEQTIAAWFPLPSPSPYVYWYNTASPPDCNPTSCSYSNACGLFPNLTQRDQFRSIEVIDGVTCGTAKTIQRSVTAFGCPVQANGSLCRQKLDVPGLGGLPLAAQIGCELPPTSSPCDENCPSQTGSGGTASVGGGGAGFCDGGTGPGARLRHLAGGVGHPGFPGTTATWTTELGRYWSHDYAQRIVVDPDESHVWLMTEFATFREFSALEAPGPALRAYGKNSPSDEYRTLFFDTTTSGWELHDLDGTVMTFDSAGRWTQTEDRNGNTTAAFYTGSALTSVTFADGRSETFAYDVGGKLDTITEVGVDGATSHVWSYTWNGDDLERIDRPDGTAFEFFYDNPALPGYLTRAELEGTDNTSQRVVNAWEYDADGNVVKSWRGDTTTDATGAHPGAAAVDLWSLSFDDPKYPTETTVTDPLGNTTDYDVARDGDNLKPKVTMISGDCPICGLGPTTEFKYEDTNHPLLPTETIDASGTRTTFAYDANGRMTSRTEAVGVTGLERVTTWAYDANFPAFPTLIQQPSTSGTGSRETTMVYDPATGDLNPRTISGTEAGAAFSLATSTTYNSAGQPLTINPPGFDDPVDTDITSFSYTVPPGEPDRNGLLPFSRTDPLVGTTSFAYDPFNRRIAVTDPNGVATETQYDDLDRVRKVIQRAGTLGVGFNLGDAPQAGDLVTESVYNVFGDLFRTILPKLNVIEYGYDAAGRLESIARKPGAASPAAECTVFTLDGAGNRTREELRDGDCSTGIAKSSTDFVYKNRIQLERIDHADGTATEYAYDANGNLEKVWDANHPKGDPPATPTQTYVYDELDRLREILQPWAGPTRPICQAGDDPGEAITRYGYDVQDHLTSVTDAECNTTSYVYSDRDLLTSQVSPVSGTTSFTYNKHGELGEETDARGALTKRIPDELDRVTKVEYLTGGTTLVPELTTDYAYDDPAVDFSKGRLTAISRNGASVDYTYDRFGRVTQDGGLGYGYDDNGNRTTVDYPSGVTATYTYDFADRQETLSVDDGVNPAQSVVTAATYLPSGPLATLNLGNGAVETRGFTTRYFPQTIDLNANLQRTWTYTTDNVGNITQVVETTDCQAVLEILDGNLSGPDTQEACMTITSEGTTIESGTVVFRAGESIELSDFTVNAGATFIAENDPRLAAVTTFTYGYLDNQYFLTCATGPWGPTGATCNPTPSSDALQWTYDRIGNRLSEIRTIEVEPEPEIDLVAAPPILAPITQTYTYTYIQNAVPANTPILDEIALDGGGTREYDYGLAGHLELVTAGANVIDFISDAAGRLSGLDRLGEMANFTYDGRSFLQRAERPLGASGQATTDPTYSSEGLLHCLTRQEDLAATPETVDYFYFAGRPVAQRHGDGATDTWTFLTTDHLGTPAMATDLAGEEAWLGPFEPFGGDYGTGAAAEKLFLRLPGQWDDGRWAEASQGADLYYSVHRWYAPGVGTYAREDPEWKESLMLEQEHPAAMGPYLYAAGQPLLEIDPLGLLSFKFHKSCQQLPENQRLALEGAADDAAQKVPQTPSCKARPRQSVKIKCGSCGGNCGRRILGTVCVNMSFHQSGKCGVGPTCLASTMLHEIVHTCGGDQIEAYACEKRFYGDTCRFPVPRKFRPPPDCPEPCG